MVKVVKVIKLAETRSSSIDKRVLGSAKTIFN